MAPELPGFYYDPVKKKYFAIERSATAPSNAAWSADNVKRRKLEAEEASGVRRRLDRRRAAVRRSKALADPLTGGFLQREFGHAARDLSTTCWTLGLRGKGYISLRHRVEESLSPNIPLFYISNHDTKTDLGVAYGSLDEETLIGSYIPTDGDDVVNFDADPQLRPERLFGPRAEVVRLSQMSSIKYHEPSHRILLTSREPGQRGGICFFSPVLSDPNDAQPLWLLGESSVYQRLSIPSVRDSMVVHTSTPAPPSSNMVCAIGTNDGILQMPNESMLVRLTPEAGRHHGKPVASEIFSLDFLAGNPSIILAGGRSSHLWMLDLRVPSNEWEWIRHRSSIAHVRSVNEHQVLAAGVRSAMSLYDIRFRRARGHRNWPLLTFPAYRNEAHLHIGLDVEPAYGVVAAAHDDGVVALYSLHTGGRLPCPAVDGVLAAGPVKAIMFQTLPRDVHPSLFVGRGPLIRKYSFGVMGGDREE